MINIRSWSVFAINLLAALTAFSQPSETAEKSVSRANLAAVASTSSSARYAQLTSLNDGITPTPQANFRRQQQRSNIWVQYEWSQPVSTSEIAVYWWDYNNSLRLPQAYRITYWNGQNFVPVNNPQGLGLENNRFNSTRFDEVNTTKMRIEVDSADRLTSTLIEWMVYPSANSKPYPPVITAGADRDVMISGKTYLHPMIK